MSEQLANLYSTTLSAAYTAGDGVIHVTSAVGAPSSGTFSLVILNNAGAVLLIFRVTSVAGTAFSGAAEGPDANAANGSTVEGTMLTTAAMNQIETDSLPIIENAGVPVTVRKHINFTGAGVTAADAGGKTVVTIPGGGGGSGFPSYTPPTGFTLRDGLGTATYVTDAQGFSLQTPFHAGNNVIYADKPIVRVGGKYTATLGLRASMPSGNFSNAGIVISDGTKLETLRFRNNFPDVDLFTWTNFSTPSALVVDGNDQPWGEGILIVQVVDDGTHRTWLLMDSYLRVTSQFFQEPSGAFLTETSIGFMVLCSSGNAAWVTAIHYTQT